MADLTLLAQPAVAALNQPENTTEDLYKELGLRLKAMQEDVSLSSSFNPPIPQNIEAQGAAEDFRKFGEMFFQRVEKEAFNLICGTQAQENEQREKVLDAFGIGRDAVGAAIAGLLISQLGLAPLIAPVVATIILRLVFKPMYESMCGTWKENLADR